MLGKGPRQQALGLHGQEIFTIDPDHVDRAGAELASGLLAAHPLDYVGGVGHLDVFRGYAKTFVHLAPGPLDVVVDIAGATPGIELHRLPMGLALNVAPRSGALGERRQREAGGQG